MRWKKKKNDSIQFNWIQISLIGKCLNNVFHAISVNHKQLFHMHLWKSLTVYRWQAIDPSLRAWLTGDLTNYNAESAICLTNKSDGRVLTSVNLNLKNGVYWRLSAVEINMFWCSFMFILCFKYIWKDDRFTCLLNWGVSLICYDSLKSHKTVFIVWISFKKPTQFESWEFVSY